MADSSSSSSVSKRLSVDSLVGVTAGFALSWFITPMDCAVMESMATAKYKNHISVVSSLRTSLKQIVTKPHRFMMQPQFAYVFGTYGGTYLAKNYIDTICKHTKQKPENTAFYKFWLVFAVNGGLSVFWKDPGLARIVKQNVAHITSSNGANTAAAVKSPAMTMTYIWWLSRDTLHMIGAAVLPDYLEEKLKWNHKQWQMAQLTFPVITQCITTPCHLLGLDYFNYNDRGSVKLKDRLQRVRKGYIGAVGVRMIRMWAPWSIGLLINREFRDYLNGDEHH